MEALIASIAESVAPLTVVHRASARQSGRTMNRTSSFGSRRFNSRRFCRRGYPPSFHQDQVVAARLRHLIECQRMIRCRACPGTTYPAKMFGFTSHRESFSVTSDIEAENSILKLRPAPTKRTFAKPRIPRSPGPAPSTRRSELVCVWSEQTCSRGRADDRTSRCQSSSDSCHEVQRTQKRPSRLNPAPIMRPPNLFGTGKRRLRSALIATAA